MERAHQFEAIRGMTYYQLAGIIDNMALEIEGGVIGITPVVNVEEEPQINFFAESPVEHHPPYQVNLLPQLAYD